MKLDKQEWVLGSFLDSGTYGKVHFGESLSGEPVAIKLIANRPGADRELLFDGAGKRNVIPILDSGTYGNDYVIVMPRAEKSLLDHLKDSGGALPLEECAQVLTDIATALADLDGGIVHRDLKPGNVLLWNGTWHLADFGTARFADAERPRPTRPRTPGRLPTSAAAALLLDSERPSRRTSSRGVGVMVFRDIHRGPHFPGPGQDDFRDQHVGRTAPALTNAPTSFAALVAACLFKSPQTRPTPKNLLARLGKISQPPVYPGLAGLVQANQSAVAERARPRPRHRPTRSTGPAY